jgi:GAF domain-containing protein/anti-sigma regulatory factor (Ser/Thr protein kinase)
MSAADVATDHATRLQEVTAGLAAAATTAEIADVIINHGIPALAARTGILGVLERSDELRFIRSVGYGEVFPERLSLDEPWPIAAAVRTKQLIELRDLPERRAAYAVPEAVWEASAPGTLVAVPLLVADRAVGALGFTREESRPLSPDERRLVETLARQAALALERASLFEADRRARIQAEGLQRVASAVARAATMGEVAEAVASEALTVLDAAGVTVVVARADDGWTGDVLASRGLVAAYANSEPQVSLESSTVTAEAIRSLQPLFVESEQQLEAGWPASARVAHDVGVRAIACLPFEVGKRRGALSVVLSEARPFLTEERTFLELLARSCEQGLLRASLYEAEQAARSRSDILHALAATLSGSVAVAEVGSAFLDHALDHLSAGSGSVLLVDEDETTLTSVAVGGSGATRSRWLSSLSVTGDYVAAAAFRRGKAVAASTRAQIEADFPATADRFGTLAQAAYAGPLIVGGKKIGAYGLVFERPRDVSRGDAQLLATMADLCAQAIERARLYESEHHIAQRLQHAMLPTALVQHPDVEIAATYRAGTEAMEVGGDWYDTFTLPNGSIGLAVGDVVGHGIEAAAAMGRLRSALAAYALEETTPAEVMARLNRFGQSAGGVDFATACYALFDPASGGLTYSSAGHPPLLVVDGNGEGRWLEVGRAQPLYGDAAFEPAEAQATLEPEDLLLLYSDGLIERRGEHIDLGLARLEAAARALRDLPLDELCARLVDDLCPMPEQGDDVVIVALRASPVAGRPFRRIFPASSAELRSVRAAARHWLDARSIGSRDRDDIVLALGEACANAVEHAYEDKPGDVEVGIASIDEELVLHVRDFGSWRSVPNTDPDRGRGYLIMRALSSGVEVESGPRGTTVTMRFRPEQRAGR